MSEGPDCILSVEISERVSAAIARGRRWWTASVSRCSEGVTTALVGESGCGKSVTALSVMRLIEPPGRDHVGQGLVGRARSAQASEHEMEHDPRRADRHGVSGSARRRSIRLSQSGVRSRRPSWPTQTSRPAPAERQAIELLTRVGVQDAARRIHDYPHHFSGGMRQRVLIAAAISLLSQHHHRRRADDRARRDGSGEDLALLHDLQAGDAGLLVVDHA